MIGVAAFFGTGIDCCGYVVVGSAGDHGAVGVGGGAVERRVDHGVGAARDGAAIDVIADGAGRCGPGEVDDVLSCGYAGAGQGLSGGRVGGVAGE